MEQITIGQIAVAVAFFVTLITGFGSLSKATKNWISKAMKEQMDEIRQANRDLKKHIDNVDLQATKNFLVARLSEVEKGTSMNEIESERFWEEYEHYAEMGGNSYIKRKVEQLKVEGKL